jgi:thioredoxin 1
MKTIPVFLCILLFSHCDFGNKKEIKKEKIHLEKDSSNLVEHADTAQTNKELEQQKKRDSFEITNFNDRINVKKIVLVCFTASWSEECKLVEKVIPELAGEYGKNLDIVEVNCDYNENLMKAYGVRNIPHYVLFKNGQKVYAFIGHGPDGIKQFSSKKRTQTNIDIAVKTTSDILRKKIDHLLI